MTSSIDSTGAAFDTVATLKDNLLTRFKSTFGANIKTDDQSVFGLLANAVAEALGEANSVAREVLNARNPQAASGVHLTNVAAFNGLSRRVPVYSTVSLSCTAASTGSTIPAGSQVRDPDNASVVFETDSILVLGSSATGTVSATATTAGAVSAAAGTLTEIVSPVFGWVSVTNAAAASEGYTTETDTAFRGLRKLISTRAGNQSLPAIYRSLASIAEISKLTIYENYTNRTDAYGQPAKSIWVAASGGSDADIAQAIRNARSAGISSYGSTSVTFTDATQGVDVTEKFSRPMETPIVIALTIQKRANFPSDGETQIKDALVSFFDGEFVLPDGETDNGFEIGEDCSIYRLLTPINSIGGHIVKSIYIGREGESLSANDLIAERLELFTLVAEGVQINDY